MNGPEHYTAAEQFLDAAAATPGTDGMSEWNQRQAIAHAILALAAATALKGGFWDESGSSHGRTLMSWVNAAGRAGEGT